MEKEYEISREELLRLAALAELDFGEEELDRMGGELKRMIAFVEGLSAGEGEISTPCAALSLSDLREDRAEAGIARDVALQNAPAQSEGYITVPRVVE